VIKEPQNTPDSQNFVKWRAFISSRWLCKIWRFSSSDDGISVGRL